MLGFAAPRTQLSLDVRTVVDGLISTADTDEEQSHLVTHMRRGLEQLESFMRQAHTDPTTGAVFSDFEAMVKHSSKVWEDHVDRAVQDKRSMKVNERRLQASLRLPLSGVDLKVGRPGRPDDNVYQRDAYARQYMPRGNFIAEWKPESSTKPLYFPLLRAYRKFTGQEDDAEENGAVNSEVLSKFFTKPVAQSEYVISTTKENGEAAHLAVLQRSDGEYLFVVGSKNTHLVVQSYDDIERACEAGRVGNNGDPYLAAAPIARALLKKIESLSPENKKILCEFLAQTRVTASFENLSPGYQHVQLLDYLTEDTPVFYGLSFPSFDAIVPGADICVNPVLAYALMAKLGFQTVTYKVLPYTPDVMEATLHSIRASHQHEGAVNLFLDSEACVIGMEKYKTVWYVCLRAIRERAKSFLSHALPKKGEVDSHALSKCHVALQKRFLAIQVYLSLSDTVRDAYLALGEQFVTYLQHVHVEPCLKKDEGTQRRLRERVGALFPVVWREFLEYTKLSDQIHDEN
ncbi:hypothetical protein Poli38472_007068 [Pythium oligandrum]|uniref:DUF7920 domain-containing protein n=1 Tax=Pythium oligandrum TaxID=41045 RepID=A0A8K1C9J5_PYTOL|nr:hypothetical protein Poli38472_007068 [Pythium oligandrum]|eukprot:TMW58923.1 hypothetical protein Poli38472_007068 [Pythium oligandrum]